MLSIRTIKKYRVLAHPTGCTASLVRRAAPKTACQSKHFLLSYVYPKGHGQKQGLARSIFRRNRNLFKANSVAKTIMPVLRACAVSDFLGEDYDAGFRRKGSGGHNKKMRIEDAAFDNAMAAGVAALNSGLSMPAAAFRATQFRLEGGKSPVSWNF